jgi:hypothetical protein
MPQEILANIAGLITNPSPLTTKPGSLTKASNIVIDRPNTASSRRGFKRYGTTPTAIDLDGEYVGAMFTFENKIHVQHGNTLTYDSDGAGTWDDYSTQVVPDDNSIGVQFVKQNNSVYMATANGVLRLDAAGTEPELAGIEKALGATAALSGPTGGGWMAKNTAVAYRILWLRKGNNDVILKGAPSERIEIINPASGSIKDVTLTIQIPSVMTVNNFFQIYRSIQSTGEDVPGSDEMGLIYEAYPTAGEISAGTITVVDIVIDDLIGAPLYTSDTQEGITQANGVPPLCGDIHYFNDSMFFSNCTQKHKLLLTLLGVGTGGLQVNDTITINGITYTAKAVENVAARQFAVTTTSTPAQNIANAAKSLINVINLSSATDDVYAYYVSGYEDLPGKILLKRRSFSTTAFNTSSSNLTAWSPAIPTASPMPSTNDNKPNRVYFSKWSEWESVPELNYLDAGTDASAVIRMYTLKEALYIFKDNGELWRITGQTPETFRIDLWDNIALYAPKTIATLGNSLYAFMTQGIMALGISGKDIQSFVIEDLINAYLNVANHPYLKYTAWAVAGESDRKYYVSLDETIYVYNYFTDTWTTFDLDMIAGMLHDTEDRLYMIDQDGFVLVERKNRDEYDYADGELTFGIYANAINSKTLYLSTSVSAGDILVGDEIRQGDLTAKVTAIGLAGGGTTIGNVTLDTCVQFTTSAATANKPIKCELEFSDNFGESPEMMKRYRNVFIGWRDKNKEFTVVYKNNFRPNTPEEFLIQPQFYGLGWGDGEWGEFPWGGMLDSSQEYRCAFPLNMRRALWSKIGISTDRAFTSFSLNQVGIAFEGSGERFSKDGKTT